MPTINNFKWIAGSDPSTHKQVGPIIEANGIITPFNALQDKSTFELKKTVKIKNRNDGTSYVFTKPELIEEI